MIKYNKILFVLSFIVVMITINVFTFTAVALEGKNNGLTPIETIDTKDLIEINLYDYGTNINYNNKNGDYGTFYPGFTQSGGAQNDWVNAYLGYTPFVQEQLAQGYLNQTTSYYMGDTIVTDLNTVLPNTSPTVNSCLNSYSDEGIYKPLYGLMYNKLQNGYPAIRIGLTSGSLEYLFSQNTYAKKYGNLTNLFQYDEITGSYYYSSKDNHAELSDDNTKFVVYDKKITPDYMMYPFGNFLPFNKINTQTTKVSSIDRNTILSFINSAKKKSGSQYGKLVNSLNAYDIAMRYHAGNNYTSYDSVDKYISVLNAGGNLSLNSTQLNNLKNEFDNLYTVDYDEAVNFFFGFDMKLNFMQPKNGLTGKNNDNKMVFRFEGDDDVWVYIDDTLFLDLSGVHAQVGGEIDFNEGVVRYYKFDKTAYAASRTPYKTVSFASILGSSANLNSKGTFNDYSTHSLNFYYMERGASSGVMTTKFNMPLIPEYGITIGKEVTSDENVLGNPNYQFQVVKPNSGSSFSSNQLFVAPNYTFNVYNLNGEKIRTDKTDSNGIINLKKGEYAIISGIKETAGKYQVREIIPSDLSSQYSSVSVNGSIVNGTTVTIGGKQYYAYSSSTYDMTNGAGSFVYTNSVGNLSKLNIKKIVSGTASDTAFDINVKIDGADIPVGTPYKIGSKSYSVIKKGIISIKNGETAIIDKIFAGASYEVVEDESSAIGYIVAYKNQNGTVSISGTTVEVTNTEKTGAVIEIPVKKMTTNSDGVKYTYTFVLFDIDTNQEVSRKTITVDGSGNGNVVFDVKYSYANHSNAQTIHKYKIYEEKVATLNGNITDNKYISYDESIYDIEVKVVNGQTGLTASIQSIKKGNESVSEIVFNNKRLASLTLEKIVDGRDTSGEFNFNIESVGLLDGTYKTDGADTITFSNGRASLKLTHNKSITIYGLPYNSKFNITETNGDGYVTKYSINSGEFKNGSSVTNVTLSNKDTTVTFKNVLGYELPKTGSSGMLIMTFLGTLFISVSSIYLLKRK